MNLWDCIICKLQCIVQYISQHMMCAVFYNCAELDVIHKLQYQCSSVLEYLQVSLLHSACVPSLRINKKIIIWPQIFARTKLHACSQYYGVSWPNVGVSLHQTNRFQWNYWQIKSVLPYENHMTWYMYSHKSGRHNKKQEVPGVKIIQRSVTEFGKIWS